MIKTKTMTKNSFIDTDIIMKIGGIKGQKLLKKIFLSLNCNLFIHEYVMKEELIFGSHALEQLNEMISLNEICIMSERDLSKEESEEYTQAVSLLAKDMNVDLTKKRQKNAGEVKSMAMAFAKNYEYFISDDREARVVAKRNLLKLDGTYLETIRFEDIIVHIKNNSEKIGISRKIA